MDRLLVVIFGLMGVGKTTVARALGEARGWPVIHSDAVRKALAAVQRDKVVSGKPQVIRIEKN